MTRENECILKRSNWNFKLRRRNEISITIESVSIFYNCLYSQMETVDTD